MTPPCRPVTFFSPGGRLTPSLSLFLFICVFDMNDVFVFVKHHLLMCFLLSLLILGSLGAASFQAQTVQETLPQRFAFNVGVYDLDES